MKLICTPITHNIARCQIANPATVIVGPNERVYVPMFCCSEWNMSAVIARHAEIWLDGKSAVLEWQGDGPVQVRGDLDLEILQAARPDEQAASV